MELTEKQEKLYQYLITQPYWDRKSRQTRLAAKCAVLDDFFCQYCGVDLLESNKLYSTIEVEHLWPRKFKDRLDFEYGMDSVYNIATVCNRCHKYRHSKNTDVPLGWVPKKDDREDNIAKMRKFVNLKMNDAKDDVLTLNRLLNHFRE